MTRAEWAARYVAPFGGGRADVVRALGVQGLQGKGSLMKTPVGRGAISANLARLRGGGGGGAASGGASFVSPGSASGLRLPGQGIAAYSAARALEAQAQMSATMQGFPYGVSNVPGSEGAAQPQTSPQQNASIATYYGQSRQTRQLPPLPLTGNETPSQIAGTLYRMGQDADKRLTVEETTAVVLLFAAEAAQAAQDTTTAANLSALAEQWAALVKQAISQQPAAAQPAAQPAAPAQPQIIVLQQPAAPAPMLAPEAETGLPGWAWALGGVAVVVGGFLTYRAVKRSKRSKS